METQPTSTQSGGIYCSACGYLNPAWRSECEKCRTKLVSPDRPAYPGSRERPGCVTAYVVLLSIGAGLTVLGTIVVGIGMMAESSEYAGGGVFLIGAAIVAGVLYFLLARGLWLLRNWARIIVIVMQSLGILGNLLSMLGALGSSEYMSNSASAICGSLGGLALGGYVLYWFASHGEYFG